MDRTAAGQSLIAPRKLSHIVTEWLLFTALAIASTYPLIFHMSTHLPQGVEPSATVPLFNLWSMWWNVDRIFHAYADYWNAPIYHPEPGIFAGSEPLTAVGWLAWPLWKMTARPPLVYNLLVLAFVALNGWFGCALLRRLRVSWPSALAGGAMLCLLPLVHWQLGIFQLIAVWGIVWTYIAVLEFRRRPRCASATHLAIAFTVTYLLCCYYGLFLGMLLLFCSPLLFARKLNNRAVWMWGAYSISVALLALSPVILAQLRFRTAHAFPFPNDWIEALSATPLDYLRAPGTQLVHVPDMNQDRSRYPWPLSPGTLKILAACIGIGFGVWTRRRRRTTLWILAILVAAVMLSTGPGLGVAYRVLADYFPGFGQARNLFRFAFFAQISVVILGGVGLHTIHTLLLRQNRLRNYPRVVTSIVVALSVLLVAEAWPRQPTLHTIPTAAAESQVVQWLSEHEDACLAFFPQPADYKATSFEPTGKWMYYQMFHRRPMVNGYSAFVPQNSHILRDQLKGFPDGIGATALRDVGVTHVVVDLQFQPVFDRSKWKDLGLKKVLTDSESGFEIWQLGDE